MSIKLALVTMLIVIGLIIMNIMLVMLIKCINNLPLIGLYLDVMGEGLQAAGLN